MLSQITPCCLTGVKCVTELVSNNSEPVEASMPAHICTELSNDECVYGTMCNGAIGSNNSEPERAMAHLCERTYALYFYIYKQRHTTPPPQKCAPPQAPSQKCVLPQPPTTSK